MLLCIKALLLVAAIAGARLADAENITHIEIDQWGSAAAVIVPDQPLVHTAQLLPLNSKAELQESVVEVQLAQLFKNVALALEAGGASLASIVELSFVVHDDATAAYVQMHLRDVLPAQTHPATNYVVSSLPVPGALVAAEAVAIAPGPIQEVIRKTVPGLYDTGCAQVAVQPGIATTYIAGHPKEGGMADATQAAMESLHAYLAHAGGRKQDVVLIKCFLQPMAEATGLRRAIAAWYEGQPPPLSFVEWISDKPTEIALVAHAPASGAGGLTFSSGPKSEGHPSQFSDIAVLRSARIIFMSGIYAAQEGLDGEAEIRDIFATFKARLEKAGSNFRHVANMNYYVSSRETNSRLGVVRPEFYEEERPPAANRIGVRGVGLAGRSIVFVPTAAPSP